MCIVLYASMFFAQLQVSFIAHAYGDESEVHFVKSAPSHSSKKLLISNHSNDETGKAFSKLNKRYPLNYSFTLFSPLQVIHPSFAFAYLHRIYTQPFLAGNFNNAFSHRGPPSFC